MIYCPMCTGSCVSVRALRMSGPDDQCETISFTTICEDCDFVLEEKVVHDRPIQLKWDGQLLDLDD